MPKTFCVVDMAERIRQHEEALELAKDNWIENRVAELLESEYRPFTPENMVEAFGNSTPQFLESLAPLVESGSTFLGVVLKQAFESYWESQAEIKAMGEL